MEIYLKRIRQWAYLEMKRAKKEVENKRRRRVYLELYHNHKLIYMLCILFNTNRWL